MVSFLYKERPITLGSFIRKRRQKKSMTEVYKAREHRIAALCHFLSLRKCQVASNKTMR